MEALSISLKEKVATAAQLQSGLQSSHQLVSSTTEQLLQLLKLQPQIVELECKLQEAEYEQQQAVLERRAVVQEMEAGKKLEERLRSQLGELCGGARLHGCITSPCLLLTKFVLDILAWSSLTASNRPLSIVT